MPIPESAPSPRRALLRDEVYERLCNAIVDGTFHAGEQLRDIELATWLGVSRTPVREALLQLARTGLVVATPGRSTVVAAVDPKTVRDAQQVVASMHHLAVRTAAGALTADDLTELREANRRFAKAVAVGDAQAALTADDDLHGVLVRVAANDALSTVLDQFTPVLRRVELLRFGSLAGRRSITLHAELITACAAGDADAAAAASDATWGSLGHLIDLS